MIVETKKIVIPIVLAFTLIRCNACSYEYRLNKVRYLDNEKYGYENSYHHFMQLDKTPEQLPKLKINRDAEVKERVCIGVCVRDCESFFENSISKIERIADCFLESCIVFYENGSSDNSKQKLMRYCEVNKNAILLTEDYDISQFPRTVRLARGRNICLSVSRKIKPKFYIVSDFDSVIENLKVRSFLTIFNQAFEWDGLFANQKGIYYDLWALRTYDDWMEYDCWEACDWLSKRIAVTNHYRNVPKEEIIPVISAFGGLAIYKQQSLKNCFYYGYKNGRECCEHVHLHKQMVNNNKKLFILGSLINH